MFTVQLVHHFFQIQNQYPYIEALCRDYIVDDVPTAPVIAATEQDLLYENKDGGNWAPPYLESLAVYRKICEQLIEDDILLFHCSALSMDGNGVLFTAPSGTGKSTHAGLWRKIYGDRIVTVNDDKPLLSVTKEEIRVFGTPYGGKDNLQTNTSAPVKAIVFLRQAPENRMEKLSQKEAFPLLFSQTYRSDDPVKMMKTLDLINRLAALPIYRLECTISVEAAELCHHTIFEGN